MSLHASLRRRPGFAVLPLIGLLVAACSSSAATPTTVPTATPAATAAVTAAPTDTPTAAPTDTSIPAPSATGSAAPTSAPTSAPTPTPAARVAWVHGQTVKQDVLAAPGIGWVLTTTGLWQTIDDGVSWANAYPHSLLAGTIRGLGALDASHALLAAVDVGHSTSTYYIWRTSDAGRTWVYTALPPITHDVLMTPCAPGDFCGQPGDPPATFDYVDANTAFVTIQMHSGVDGLSNNIFETTNGGATWVTRSFDATLLSSGPTPGVRVQFMTPSIGVAEAQGEAGSTTTGWGHWTYRLFPTGNNATPDISFISSTNWAADEGIDYGTVNDHYAVSHDGGATWVDHQYDVPGVANLAGARIRFLSSLVWIGTVQTSSGGGYATGPATTIYTVDGGVHFATYGLQPFNGSTAAFIDADHGWTGPNDLIPTAKLYSTSDRGLHWRLLTP